MASGPSVYLSKDPCRSLFPCYLRVVTPFPICLHDSPSGVAQAVISLQAKAEDVTDSMTAIICTWWFPPGPTGCQFRCLSPSGFLRIHNVGVSRRSLLTGVSTGPRGWWEDHCATLCNLDLYLDVSTVTWDSYLLLTEVSLGFEAFFFLPHEQCGEDLWQGFFFSVSGHPPLGCGHGGLHECL